jgi:dihydropteroate synthase
VSAGLPGLAGLPAGRTLVVGVVNATPDSFSDGGRHWAPGDAGPAVARGLALLAEGADLVDVGGESTRPGAGRVDPEEEASRVVPVVRELAAAGAVVSVDTTRAAVAAAALDAGALVVNDVSGGLGDPAMVPLLARTGAACVVMHWRGESAGMDARAEYGPEGVVAAVRRELGERLRALAAAGVDPAQVVLDPGLGFAKRGEHDLALLAALPELVALGRPLLVGASRKRFLGAAVARPGTAPVPPEQRDAATAAVTALAAAAGAWAVRVHEVAASADAVRVAAAVAGAASGTAR